MLEFEWDEDKKERNFTQHGLDFFDVLPLFSKPDKLIFEDTRKDYGEKRYILMGELNSLFLQIVFTIRKTKIRLISARRGNKRERRTYDENQKTTNH